MNILLSLLFNLYTTHVTLVHTFKHFLFLIHAETGHTWGNEPATESTCPSPPTGDAVRCGLSLHDAHAAAAVE